MLMMTLGQVSLLIIAVLIGGYIVWLVAGAPGA